MSEERFHKIASRVSAVGRIHTAGRVEFVKDTGPVRRDIRVQDYEFSPEARLNLAKILWSTQRAHSYAITAYRLFSRIPSSKMSPDGLLGGRGYISNIKDMRASMAQAVEALSSFTDTLHDELDAPHWKDKQEDEQVSGIVEDAVKVKSNPEQFVEDEFKDEEGAEFEAETVENPDANDFNPMVDSDRPEDTEDEENVGEWGDTSQAQVAASFAETAQKEKHWKQDLEKTKEKNKASQLPSGTGDQKQGITEPEAVMNTTAPKSGNYASAAEKLFRRQEMHTASVKTADSSIDPSSLSGPRVEHVGPGESDFNGEESWGSDDPTGAMLSGGTNVTNPLYEDWTMDGVTGYDNVIDGDSSVLQISTKLASAPQTYSWLPGADNSKNLDYYQLGLSAEEIEYMKAHNQPDIPPGILPPKKKLDIPNFWNRDF